MNYYTMLWSQNTCNKAIGLTGEISTNISCNQFIKRGVREGDRIYSVGTRNGSVILIAALTVGEILLSRQAFRLRAGFEPWSADEHILAQPGSGTPMDFENILPVKVVQALQFVSGKTSRGLTFHAPGKVDQQTLRSIRQLLPGSAHLLEEHLRK